MNVPTSWGKLLLKDFLKVCEILDSNESDYEKRMQIISHFIGYDANEVPFVHTGLKRFYKPNLEYYLKRCEKLLKSPKPNKVYKSIWIGNRRYSTDLDATTLCANQYTAIATFTANGKAEVNIHRVLAVVYYRHPLFKGYGFDSKQISAIEKELLNARLSDVYGCMLFFCTVAEQLSAVLPTYLMRMEEEIHNETMDLIRTWDSDSSMVGITS